MTPPRRVGPRMQGRGRPQTVSDDRIVGYLEAHPATGTGVLARAMGLDHSTIHYRLRSLSDEGLVVGSVAGPGRERVWWTADDPDAGTLIVDVELEEARV